MSGYRKYVFGILQVMADLSTHSESPRRADNSDSLTQSCGPGVDNPAQDSLSDSGISSPGVTGSLSEPARINSSEVSGSLNEPTTIHEEEVPVIVRRRGCMLRLRITSYGGEDLESYDVRIYCKTLCIIPSFHILPYCQV